MQLKRIVPCPNCKKPVEYSITNPLRPFCSEKCKLIDLGQWLIESYHISSPDDQSDAVTDFEQNNH